MSEYERLTHEDIRRLMNSPDTETKVKVVEKLSNQYKAHEFTDDQLKLADQIFRLLLKQAEIEVRKALSDNLMSSRNIPHDVVLSLARDVEEVALPVLEFSEVLTDEDLVDIVRSTEKTAYHIAIAGRSHVSEQVSDALVETKNEEVVNTLLQNENAQIAEKSYNKVLTNFAQSEKIVSSMIVRGSLPERVVGEMTKKVSIALQKKLEKKYEQSFAQINQFFKESGEVAALKLQGMQIIDRELMELVDNLEQKGNLEAALHPVHGQLSQLLDGLEQLGQITPLSALALGHLALFKISISRLTGIPFENVGKLTADREGGLQALYERVQLPPKMFQVVQFVTSILRRMDLQAKAGVRPHPKDDLYGFIQEVTKESKGKHIPNLAHFIALVNQHIDQREGEW